MELAGRFLVGTGFGLELRDGCSCHLKNLLNGWISLVHVVIAIGYMMTRSAGGGARCYSELNQDKTQTVFLQPEYVILSC